MACRWFQSSLLTSVAATGAAPYKTVLTHGALIGELFGEWVKKRLCSVQAMSACDVETREKVFVTSVV